MAGRVSPLASRTNPNVLNLSFPPVYRHQPPYLEPPCWSEPYCPPHQGWGNNCVISPPSLGASPPCRKSPREETTGLVRPLRKGKYPSPQTCPSSLDDPKSCVCVWGVGVSGMERKQAGRVDSCGCNTRRCLQQLPQLSHCPPGEQGTWVSERR